MSMFRINVQKPHPADIHEAAECLRRGGLIIYPTDTVYALGCDSANRRAIEKLCAVKGVKPEKANLSFIFYDLSHLADYTRVVNTPTYKMLRKALPGPFTFILEANSRIPKLFKNNKKTIGIRIPDNEICRQLVRELGNPILSTSVHDEDDILDYTTDPEIIYEKYKKKVDLVINGGFSDNTPSTVVDCTGEKPVILRQGLGVIEGY